MTSAEYSYRQRPKPQQSPRRSPHRQGCTSIRESALFNADGRQQAVFGWLRISRSGALLQCELAFETAHRIRRDPDLIPARLADEAHLLIVKCQIARGD